jgi:hypothetical protein
VNSRTSSGSVPMVVSSCQVRAETAIKARGRTT